jgi:hypothetical protein
MQSKATQQRDLEHVPAISGGNENHVISVTDASLATDMHAGISTATAYPSGKYVTITNIGANVAYVAFDSVSGGTAATTSNAHPIPVNESRRWYLEPEHRPGTDTTPTYANRYLKAICAAGQTATLHWYISTWIPGTPSP